MADRATVKSIFNEALGKPEPERGEYLARACAGDADLCREVEELLRAHAGGPVLDAVTIEAGTAEQISFALNEQPGSRIHQYKLLQKIGEGGFGTVFMAEQEEPVRRRVALKIIKLGMDTRQVVARFEQERQALALMDHPHIAKVLDAGTTASGRPYFVMELVSGEPITGYCDRFRLSIEGRLELFIQVCQAVQHAHSKAIIHRDIKPSNVLVSTLDGKPHAKVIDFGIAKATAARLTEKTLFTEHRQFVGTPQYMSPEQAEASQDIDTRSDVYSLGVLLYELLTGVTPFDANSLRSAAYAEIQRIIREVEPPKPSTRLSTLQDSIATVAATRQIEPARLTRIIRGDLDWIVMKCLDKERARRYETANGLAMEIQRFLKGEPVLAGPPTARYRLGKFVRRHKAFVGAASLFVVMVTAAASGMTLLYFRALAAEHEQSLQRERADREAAEARKQAEIATTARADAESREKQTQKVAEFQAKMLSGVDVEKTGGFIKERYRDQVKAGLLRQYVGQWPDKRRRTPAEIDAELDEYDRRADAAQGVDIAREFLDESLFKPALATVARDFAGEPQIEAKLRETIGSVYQDLGLHEAAEAQLGAALELRRRILAGQSGNDRTAELDVARTANDLAVVLHTKEKFEETHRLYEETLAIRRRHQVDDPLSVALTLTSMGALFDLQGKYDDAEKVIREALELCRNKSSRCAPDKRDHQLASTLQILARVRRGKADTRGAEQVAREALAIADRLADSRELRINSRFILAWILRERGNLDEALQLYRDILQAQQNWLGRNHHHIGQTLSNLGEVLCAKGNYSEAEQYYREAIALHRRCFGNVHSEVATSLTNMGALLDARGDYPAAESVYRQAVDIYQKVYGDEHDLTLNVLSNLAVTLSNKGDDAAAEPLFREVLFLYEKNHGSRSAAVIGAINGLAELLRRRSDYKSAEPLYRESIDIIRKQLGDDHPNVGVCMNNLALMLREKGDVNSAEPIARESLERAKKTLGPDHPIVAICLQNLAMILEEKKDLAGAEKMYREALELGKKVMGPDHPQVAVQLVALAVFLHDNGDDRAAEPLFREALAINEKKLLPKSLTTAYCRGSLGKTLTALKKHAEAESMLLKAWSIIGATSDTTSAEKRTAARRLQRLYESWHAAEPGKGYDAKAAEWREKLAEMKPPPTQRAGDH